MLRATGSVFCWASNTKLYYLFQTDVYFFLCFRLNRAVEQVKGSEEMKQKILKASRDARMHPNYSHELHNDLYGNEICQQYNINSYDRNHRSHSNGKYQATDYKLPAISVARVILRKGISISVNSYELRLRSRKNSI